MSTNTPRFPFGIPTGWFQVGYSAELEEGQVVPLRYFARDLVMFRNSTGVHILDAHCPHLGAHLGHGGTVENDNLVCPFHAWEFAGDGSCANIPYAKKKPRNTDLDCWKVQEHNGLILCWFDRNGDAPTWEVPDLEEYGNEGWTEYRTVRWTVKSCNQELAENQVDSAHFHYLHGSAIHPTTNSKPMGHILHSTSNTGMTTPMGVVEGQIEVFTHGFGFTTTRFTGLVETLLVSSATPIDEDHTELWFAFTVKRIGKGITGGVGKAFMAEIKRQLEQDIPVWEHKVYLNRPVLCDGDGPIGLFRTWCRQFYPETRAPSESAAK